MADREPVHLRRQECLGLLICSQPEDRTDHVATNCPIAMIVSNLIVGQSDAQGPFYVFLVVWQSPLPYAGLTENHLMAQILHADNFSVLGICSRLCSSDGRMSPRKKLA